MATTKQINYALHLLDKAGYRTTWMSSEYKQFATSRERSGKVRDWLASMDRQRISGLIKALSKRNRQIDEVYNND